MKKRKAWESYFIIIINIWLAVVVASYHWDFYIIDRLGGVSGQMPTIQAWVELIPLPEVESLAIAKAYPALRTTVSGVPLFLLRTLSASFLHFSWSHLFGNILSVWFIGRYYEDVNYRGTFLITYVFTGIIAMSSAAVLKPDVLTAGASGAVFGLMGASVVLSKRAQRLAIKGSLTQNAHQKYTDLGHFVYVILIYNLIGTFIMPDVSIVAHIAGLIAGCLIGLVLPIKDW